MATFNFLDSTGLRYFLNKCKDVFATVEDVDAFTEETKIYVTEVDYEKELSFDTKQPYTELIDL